MIGPTTDDEFDNLTILDMYTNRCTIKIVPSRNVICRLSFVRSVARFFAMVNDMMYGLMDSVRRRFHATGRLTKSLGD